MKIFQLSWCFVSSSFNCGVNNNFQQFVTDIGLHPRYIRCDFDPKLLSEEAYDYLLLIQCKFKSAPPDIQDKNELAESSVVPQTFLPHPHLPIPKHTQTQPDRHIIKNRCAMVVIKHEGKHCVQLINSLHVRDHRE